MKKYSASFLLIQTGIIFIISCIISIAIYAVAGAANVITSGLILAIPVMIMIGFIYVCLVNFITGPMAKKTMEKNCRAQNFGKTFTHINKDLGTVGTILKIDEETYKAIVEASAGVRESIQQKVDSEVYDKFIECIDKYQK